MPIFVHSILQCAHTEAEYEKSGKKLKECLVGNQKKL